MIFSEWMHAGLNAIILRALALLIITATAKVLIGMDHCSAA